MTDRPRYGCGRDCTVQRELSAAAEPAEPMDPEMVARFSPEVRERIAADLVEHDRVMAHHEAGHAVAATLFGRPVEYAVVGRHPHVRYASGGNRSEEAFLTATLAGRVAAGYATHCVPPPAEEEMAFFLLKVREGTEGTCDECRVATLLHLLYPNETNVELAQRWRAHFKRVADTFDAVEIRCGVRRLARALEEKIRVDRPEIEQLVGHLRPEASNAT